MPITDAVGREGKNKGRARARGQGYPPILPYPVLPLCVERGSLPRPLLAFQLHADVVGLYLQ